MNSSRLLLVAALGVLLTGAQAQTLKVGSPAPKVQFGKWIKGKEFSEFKEKGVYVMEFWATWCGPCKVAMPHLTELAKKYKNVTFTGVSVFENQKEDDFLTKVSDFVKGNDANMGYNVAADDSKQVMAKTWMDAAGLNAIPATFVIKDGKVAWIGHPASLEPVLEQISAGKFDSVGEAKKQAEAAERDAKLQKAMMPVMQAAQTGDFAKAVDAAEKGMMANPEFRVELGMTKFQLLLMSGDAKASTWAREFSTTLIKDNATLLNEIAWSFLDEEAVVPRRDNQVALEVAMRAVDASKGQDWMILDTLALAQFKNNLFVKALDNQKKAVKLMKDDKAADEKTRKEVLERLDRYEKAAKHG